MESPARDLEWDESTSGLELRLEHVGSVFENFFERSVDAVWLLDPQEGFFVDCNQAAVELIGAENKQQLLRLRPAELSPPVQPDGSRSAEKSAEIIATIQRQKAHLFEWVIRRLDGRDVPIEVSAAVVQVGGKSIQVIVSRDISERKQAERELRDLTQALERRVTERTAELSASEARFRALVENAPEAIVMYSADTGRFLFGNQHACDLYGVPMSKLAELTPVDVSPEFQPGGQRSRDLAREKITEVLAGGISVFEWVHQQPNGRLIPTEVRLLRLPTAGESLIRASIIDMTERKRAERALRESEEKFRALFEGSSQGVALHDENALLEVNSAAVRIMRRQSAQEMLGKRPDAMAPPLQPNGESSAVMARKYIAECLARGSARFEWIACAPNGDEIPLEVTLTRIEWSGRQIIQAFITDITERKEAERALRAANAELHREIEQRIRAEELLKERVRISTLNAEVAVALNAGAELQPMLQRCAELMVLHLEVAFARIWTLNAATQTLELQASAGCYTHLDGPHSRVQVGQYKIGLIAQEKKPLLSNRVQSDPRVGDKAWAAREGMVSFAGYPLLIEDRVLGVLAMFARRPLAEEVLKTLGSIADSVALGIERKRAQIALSESEARFSTAFHDSPAFLSIFNVSDGRIDLANDAYLNWLGYPRQEVLGRTCLELGLWENPDERDSVLKDIQTIGSIRQRECRWRNRRGECSTVLLSLEPIRVNGTPRMLSMAVNITQRKRAEEELRESEARLRESEARFSAAFHASPVNTAISRASDGKFVLANDAFLNWAGYERAEVLGRTAIELGLWEDIEERKQFWDEVRSAGWVRARECRMRNRRGRHSTVLASGVVIAINGEDHLMGILLDITQRKQVEAELHRTLTREMELSQLKSNFVSMVSHEFRTPLGIIQSSAELLRDFHARMQPAEREEQLESIAKNVRRMAGMMEEVLVLSRLDAGKLIFQPSALDLNNFCRRIVDEVLSATNRRCAIELTLSPILTQARVDERLLGHILTNLLNNAVKYSEPGAAVDFFVAQDGRDAVCVIRDRGIGIPEEDRPQLFKAFHRGSNVGTRPGTGLGLLLVKRCADLHGGKVQIESIAGEGTTVTVRFPAFHEP